MLRVQPVTSLLDIRCWLMGFLGSVSVACGTMWSSVSQLRGKGEREREMEGEREKKKEKRKRETGRERFLPEIPVNNKKCDMLWLVAGQLEAGSSHPRYMGRVNVAE